VYKNKDFLGYVERYMSIENKLILRINYFIINYQ